MTFDKWIDNKGVLIHSDIIGLMRIVWNDAVNAEREACAMVCDDRAKRKNDGNYTDHSWELICSTNELAADEIRARGYK